MTAATSASGSDPAQAGLSATASRAAGVTQDATASHPVSATGHITPGGYCATLFGASVGDGIISWNDTSGVSIDTAGAADFICNQPQLVNSVWVRGYFGTAPTDLFNITFYKNDPAGFDEPNDGKRPVCIRTKIKGAAGGQFPADVLTKLDLGRKAKGCRLDRGHYWVSVQNYNTTTPWYWEVQKQRQVDSGDWRDVYNALQTPQPCITFDGIPPGSAAQGGDAYVNSCLGLDRTYGDFLFELH